jgi:large subunit ribosomal protein L23
MASFDWIIKPLMTEKSARIAVENKYVFEVHPQANKIQVRRAIKEMFPQVEIEKVNTVNMPGKKKRYGRIVGMSKKWKKAVVTLRSGTIDLAQEVKEKK